MKQLSGEIQSLRASEKVRLEKLIGRRVNPHDVLSFDLAKRASQLAYEFGQQIGLLISREGKVTHVVVGTKNRIYLPDLGRYRLDMARLRRLRFVVFMPEGKRLLIEQPRQRLLSSDGGGCFSEDRAKREKLIATPALTDDFRTDLEKLRFDAVVLLAVKKDGSPGSVTFAHLEPIAPSEVLSGSTASTGVGLLCARDIHALDLDFSDFVADIETRFSSLRKRLFDTSKDQAIMVGVYTQSNTSSIAFLEELNELARTAGIEVLDTVVQRRSSVDPKTVVGKGKLEDIVLHCLDLGADLLVFDRELSPGQLRSVTNLTDLRVLDRSMLILDIFAQRAKSSEGRLQVELAQLRYSLPRLTEADSGLSRLTGGIGGRGPGETKLEIGRRRARDRITVLEKRIDRLASQRSLRRERRQSRGVPVIAIVGYTNAGKSTLLNGLTKGNVFVEDKLFATLDPSSRRMRFSNDKEVVFVDTVGFIRELPKELVSAFRATLEEVGEADLLLHVVDASTPGVQERIRIVSKTIDNLGYGDKPQLLVLNKIDCLSSLEVSELSNSLNAICISALERIGFDVLISSVQNFLLELFDGQDPGRFLELPGTTDSGSKESD